MSYYDYLGLPEKGLRWLGNPSHAANTAVRQHELATDGRRWHNPSSVLMLKNKKWMVSALLVIPVSVGGWLIWRYFQPKGLPEGFASGNGRIEGTEVAVATKFARRIAEILVNEGDFVASVPIEGSIALFLAGTALHLFATTSLGIFMGTVARRCHNSGYCSFLCCCRCKCFPAAKPLARVCRRWCNSSCWLPQLLIMSCLLNRSSFAAQGSRQSG